jgi:hypothetical protein
LFLLYVAFLSWFLSRIPKDMEHMEQLFAVIDGKMAGFLYGLGACCLIQGERALRVSKAEHFMLKFHDELDREPHDVQPTDSGTQQAGPARETRTDEQYVACVRKGIRIRRWIGLFDFCIAVACLSVSLVVLRHHWATLKIYPYQDTWRSWVAGLGTGALQALAVAGLLVSIGSAAQSIGGYKTEHLLLKFHDKRRQPEAH